MYRLHSTAVNKSQWNSAPSTQWRGERMWIIGETSPSSNVSSLGSSLARAALHRKSVLAWWNSYELTSWPALQTAPSLLPGVRVGLLCGPAEANCSCLRSCDFDTKHVVSNESIVPSQGKPTTATWSPNHVSQQVRMNCTVRLWGVIDPWAKDAKEFIRKMHFQTFTNTVVRDLLVWFLHDGGKWPTAGPIEKLLINSVALTFTPGIVLKQATKGAQNHSSHALYKGQQASGSPKRQEVILKALDKGAKWVSMFYVQLKRHSNTIHRILLWPVSMWENHYHEASHKNLHI